VTDEATTRDTVAGRPAPSGLHRRVGRGMLERDNWFELIRFGVVGASGYVVNLIVFSVLVEGFAVQHLLAATAAFLIAVANNFWWNRHWTFAAGDGHAGFQAARFLAVSFGAFCLNLVILELLVSAGLAEVPAQAIAVLCATPANFLGNKLWTFGS
jgi:putative flippase GtrA